MAMLRILGLADAARDAGRVLETSELTNANGRRLSGMRFSKLAADFGPTIAIHRAVLHEILLSGCQDATLHSGTTVDHLSDQGERVEVTFSNGRTEQFDYVIGADGLRSQTRGQTFGPTRPIYSGYTCWRFVVECPPALDRMQEMWGRGRRFGLVPLAGGRLYCFATANAKAGEADPEAGRIDRFRERFSEFSGFAPVVLEQLTRPEQLIHNDLDEMPKHPWFKGRVLLIGDAAHATTPNMGQGAAMALEDAGILYEMLSGDQSFEEVVPAFAARRESRVRFIVNQSRRIGRLGQIENPLLRSLRNGVMRMIPQQLAEAGALRAAAAAI
jgi:2-polyprenyl-6-methoxyphenol hydroxylase-like FAD-dependent oxidoreductase